MSSILNSKVMSLLQDSEKTRFNVSGHMKDYDAKLIDVYYLMLFKQNYYMYKQENSADENKRNCLYKK